MRVPFKFSTFLFFQTLLTYTRQLFGIGAIDIDYWLIFKKTISNRWKDMQTKGKPERIFVAETCLSARDSSWCKRSASFSLTRLEKNEECDEAFRMIFTHRCISLFCLFKSKASFTCRRSIVINKARVAWRRFRFSIFVIPSVNESSANGNIFNDRDDLRFHYLSTLLMRTRKGEIHSSIDEEYFLKRRNTD